MQSKHFLANTIFVFHVIVFVFVFFGWLIPALWVLYIATLSVVFVSDLALGYCFLSKWEFMLRKMTSTRTRYDYNFSSFYTQKIIGQRLPTSFVQWTGIIFVGASIFINLYFHFFY